MNDYCLLGNDGYNPGGFTSIVGVVVESELALGTGDEYSLALISMPRSPKILSTMDVISHKGRSIYAERLTSSNMLTERAVRSVTPHILQLWSQGNQ